MDITKNQEWRETTVVSGTQALEQVTGQSKLPSKNPSLSLLSKDCVLNSKKKLNFTPVEESKQYIVANTKNQLEFYTENKIFWNKRSKRDKSGLPCRCSMMYFFKSSNN